MIRPLLAFAIALALSSPAADSAVKRKRKPNPASAAAAAKARALAESFVAAQRSEPGNIENAAALIPFFLRLTDAGPASVIRILHFGDSHTASDDFPNTLRQSLQRQFGAGGPGFALAGHPFPGYRRFDVTGSNSTGWITAGTLAHSTDGRDGLGGISISTQQPDRTVSLTTASPLLKLFYLRQPDGGALEFCVDGTATARIETAGNLGPAYFDYAATLGEHTYQLRTVDTAPVRLFGWSAENTAGVTYEALGINGVQAQKMLDWDDSIFTDHVTQRDPALIVLAYGTNEALNNRWTTTSYATDLTTLIARFRRAAPLASILLIGPPDCLFRNGAARLTEVIDVQRQVAFSEKCAFWDWRERMGGPGSVLNWDRAGFGQPDHVHLTAIGYRTTGEMLLEDVMEQYRRFQAVRAE